MRFWINLKQDVVGIVSKPIKLIGVQSRESNKVYEEVIRLMEQIDNEGKKYKDIKLKQIQW